MPEELKNSLWQQFGLETYMLIYAIKCPPTMYKAYKRFFYTAYHVAVFLDYYLTFPPKDFEAQLPFTIIEKNDIPGKALDDVLPDGQYSKEQLVEYIKSSKEKYHRVIMSSKQGEHPCFIEDAEFGKCITP